MSPMNVYATNLAVVAGDSKPADGLLALTRGEFHGTAFGARPATNQERHVYEEGE
jgi:hypothetical protein